VRVRTSALDGPHRGDAHDRVAEPIRGTDDDAKGFREAVGDAPLVRREKEFWLGSLPAIVDPKPVFRLPANLLLEREIQLRRDGVDVAR